LSPPRRPLTGDAVGPETTWRPWAPSGPSTPQSPWLFMTLTIDHGW